MNDANRALLVALDQFDAAEQRWRIGKVRDVGEEAPHFDLGIGAGLKRPVDLDDMVVIHQGSAAGLVGLDGADVLGLPDRLVAEAARRPEFEPQALFALIDRQRLLQVAQQQRDEDLVGGDVEQGAFAGSLPNGGQRMRVVALAVEAHPFDLHRQHVACGDVALRRFEKGEPWPVVADVAERNGRSQGRTNRFG